MGVTKTIRPLIQPLFAAASDVAPDAFLFAWDDPLTTLSDGALQPATIANESMLPVNLVASGAAWQAPLPGSLLGGTQQRWRGEAHRNKAAPIGEPMPLVLPSAEQGALLTAQTQVDEPENVHPVTPDTQRSFLSSASHQHPHQQAASTSVTDLALIQPLATAIVEHNIIPDHLAMSMHMHMDQSEQRTKPSERTGLPGNTEELIQSQRPVNSNEPAIINPALAQSISPVIPSDAVVDNSVVAHVITGDVQQNQQMNILSSLTAAISPPSIVRKPSSEPVPDLVQAAAPRGLDAIIRSQITPHQSLGVIAPMLQPVDQLQISPVPSMQDTSSTVKASPAVDERRSRTPFTEEDRVVRTHALARVFSASHVPIRPQSTALVEDQHQDMHAVEQEVRHEEQAPPIHVSIGRVDVRVSPPLITPPVVKPAPRPALSLNDYLAQRRKGVQ